MSNYFKLILKYTLVFICLIIIYFLLLTLSSIIPSKSIKHNVEKSVKTLYNDKDEIVYNFAYKRVELFNFSNAIMVNIAYSIDSKKPIESFVLARRNYIPNKTKVMHKDTQYRLKVNEGYVDKTTKQLLGTRELYDLVFKNKNLDSFNYARYWHGYLTFLRPLLLIFDYSKIMILIDFITIISMIMMLYLIFKRINITTMFIYIIGLLSVDFIFTCRSLNEVLMFLLTFISVDYLLFKNGNLKNIGIYMFILGSITCFIDCSTTPIIPFGISLITYLLLIRNNNISNREYIKKIMILSIIWFLGYIGTWITKWIIVGLFYDSSILHNVFIQILFRLGQTDSISFIDTIKTNLLYFSYINIFVLIFIVIYYFLLKYSKRNIINIKKCIPFVLTFLIPIGWFLVVKQHSYAHSLFTYRILIISVISLLLIVDSVFEK